MISGKRFFLPFVFLHITFCISSFGTDVDTSVFPPTRSWMADSNFTGAGIWINIGMERFDTRVKDFHEDSSGVGVLRRVPGWNGNNSCCSHGTHVAGIAAGNGWMSEFSGGSRYQWRGVAFKSLLASQLGDALTGGGDVNNHSHTVDGGTYDDEDQQIDRTLFNHSTYRHTVVYASGDDGASRLHSGNQGYYSLTVQAKNPITVGAAFLEVPMLAGFSSMGPTYDGRIKPDVVAPGASFWFPQKYPVPLRIYFDSIVIRNGKNGGVKKAWRFDTAGRSEGWKAQFQTDHFKVEKGALSFDSHWVGSYIRNKGFAPFISSNDDTLILGYKFVHPDIPLRMTHLQCGLGWGRDAQPDSLLFILPSPDTNGHEARFALADLWGYSAGQKGKIRRWKSGTSIDNLSFDFASDSVLAIYSVADGGNSNGNYRYEAGTSMSAPYVTGVAALLLQTYARRYLDSVALIHTHAPWNSTIKALLIHTATDLIKEEPSWTERVAAANGDSGWLNPDLRRQESLGNSFMHYHRGPDFATGYGQVNIPKALAFVDTNRFKQASIRQGRIAVYSFFVKPSSRPSPAQAGEGVKLKEGKNQKIRGTKVDVGRDSMQSLPDCAEASPSPTCVGEGRGEGVFAQKGLRATLAWDDYEGDRTNRDHSQLVNDLDLTLVSPNGRVYYPWSLKPLPHNPDPAMQGIDPIHAADIDSASCDGPNRRDNVEVVDVPKNGIVPGIWKLIVKGYAVPHGPQDFSIVCDFDLKRSRDVIKKK